MKMTQQSDPSTPESPGVGYKAVMVAMYEQTFHTFFPFVLVRNHRPFHCNVSQTLVRPGKDNTPLLLWRLNRSVVQCHKVLYSLRTPNNDGTSSRVPEVDTNKSGPSHGFLPTGRISAWLGWNASLRRLTSRWFRLQAPCENRFCKFSVAHPDDCVPPECTTTCWQ